MILIGKVIRVVFNEIMGRQHYQNKWDNVSEDPTTIYFGIPRRTQSMMIIKNFD